MPTPFSLYLDVARFLAAIFVVIAHLLQYEFIGSPVDAYIPDFGREAVIVFFVLSGFVIAFTVEQRTPSAREYIVARCARIYSVALPVLLASFVIGAVVAAYSPEAISNAYAVSKAYVYFPLHLLFLGEAWNVSETPPWLPQYWSLGYEVWYYVLFGAAWFLTGFRRVLVVGAILLLVGFKLWLLLPVWASGVFLYHWLKKHHIPMLLARAGWVLSIVLLCLYKASGFDEEMRQLGNAVWPFTGLRLGSADRFLGDYVVGVLVLANFACARFAAFDAVVSWKNGIQALASHTFTLYLVHGLVMKVWIYAAGDAAMGPVELFLLIATIGVTTYIAGLVTERRKHDFQRFFNACFTLSDRIAAAGTAALQRLR